MTTYLRIDGSIRKASRSSLLADYLLESLNKRLLLEKVNERNVGITPPASPDEEFVSANQTPDELRTDLQLARLAESDELIAEFLSAELIVIATPMYNFSAGAGLKAWVDNLIRNNKTFAASEQGIVRLAEGKRMIVLTTRGLGYGEQSPFATCDHLEPWLQDIFGFIGIEHIDFVKADNLDFAGPETAEASMNNAKRAIDQLVTAWEPS